MAAKPRMTCRRAAIVAGERSAGLGDARAVAMWWWRMSFGGEAVVVGSLSLDEEVEESSAMRRSMTGMSLRFMRQA